MISVFIIPAQEKTMGTYTTFHPHTIKKKRTHGFLGRMSSPGGRNVIKRRRKKGRKRLAV